MYVGDFSHFSAMLTLPPPPAPSWSNIALRKLNEVTGPEKRKQAEKLVAKPVMFSLSEEWVIEVGFPLLTWSLYICSLSYNMSPAFFLLLLGRFWMKWIHPKETQGHQTYIIFTYTPHPPSTLLDIHTNVWIQKTAYNNIVPSREKEREDLFSFQTIKTLGCMWK